jgi:hypothetical protein
MEENRIAEFERLHICSGERQLQLDLAHRRTGSFG